MKTAVAKTRQRPRTKTRRRSGAERDDEKRRFQTFVEDRVWADEHHQELLAQYPEQWIAVWNKRVIATDPDMMALRAKVPDPAYTCHVFLTKHNGDVLL